jgi:hypothetical protein
LALPASSKTRPAKAFRRWEGVKSSSVLNEPDNNLV